MRLRIAICDDERDQVEYLFDIVKTWAERNRHLVTIHAFASAEEFLFQYSEDKDLDILLLDVEMGKMSGVELAKEIRKENRTIQLIFITGYYEYFSDGFDVSALHYLIKPATREKLCPVLNRAVDNLSYRERFILIDTQDAQERISLSDILYIEADKVHIKVVTVRETYRSRMTLLRASELLDETFYKVHRSFIVALKYISRISKNEITMVNGDVIPMSRGISNDVHAALIKYI